MADNTTLQSESPATPPAPLVIAGDDIGPGVFYPRSKLIHGADGVNDGDVSTVNPLPVSIYKPFGDIDFGGLAGQVINSVAVATLSAAIDVQGKSRVIVGVEYSNGTGTAPIRIYGFGHNANPLVLPSRIVTPGNTGNQIATLETGYYNGEFIVIETNGVKEVKIRVEDVPSDSASVSVWAVGVR